MSRVLITGGGGFVGQWLARLLLERGDAIALAGVGSFATAPRILSDEERGAVEWVPCDVRSQSDVDAALDAVKPDLVFHLAGVAYPPDADRDPAQAYDINTLGAVRLLGAIATRRRAGTIDPSTVIVGSAVQYGAHAYGPTPLDESAEQLPMNVYGASKTAQEVVSLAAARASGARVVCTRSFNHSGIGHAEVYLLPSLVRRARALPADGTGTLVIGNDDVRDYLHVSDVVEAYVALAERGVAGEVYNVSSGSGISVHELAETVLLRAGVRAEISRDASLARGAAIPVLVGSSAKLRRDTGWAPTRTSTDIIDDLIHAAPY